MTAGACTTTGEGPATVADDVLKEIIGKPAGTTVVAVERGHVTQFAAAVKERSPVYRDTREAQAAGFAGIPAPPTYPIAMGNFGAYPEIQPVGSKGVSDSPMASLLGPLMSKGGIILHGEQEFTYHRPVYAGDVLEGNGTVVDAYQKESKGKTMTFVVVETVWTDKESGEEVCTSRMNIIHRV